MPEWPPCDIYIANADGSDLSGVTRVDGLYWYSESPLWSPDCRMIAFSSRQECMVNDCPLGYPGTDVFLLTLNGSNLSKLTDDGLSYGEGWTPGGRGLIYYNGSLGSYVWVEIDS